MPIYLDHAATTPVRTEVIEVYSKELSRIGNPSSVHKFGQDARTVFEKSREEIAKAIDCNRSEVIFTSGGTEANNLAIKGLFWYRKAENVNRKIIISAMTEHHAVLDVLEWLENHEGAEIAWVPVSNEGLLDYDWLENFLSQSHEAVSLISLMWVNNETGVISDIERVTAAAKPFEIPVHSDAVAALGHVPVSFAQSGLWAMSITGHKVGAPVGTGALVVARKANLTSLFHGGGQERGIRSGTLNAAGAAAFARAVEIATDELPEQHQKWQAFSQKIQNFITEHPELQGKITGSLESRSPNNMHLVFEGCAGDSLLFIFDSKGIAVSNGSACTAGVTSTSHVLLAMGFDEQHASGALRITFGYDTTKEDIQAFLEVLPLAVDSARKAGFVHSHE